MADTVQITMPQMGESVSEGTVLTWHKREGDWVDKDETVVEVSTDKVDAEIPAPAAGKLARILVGEDETIAVGGPLGEIEVGAAAGDGRAPESAKRTAEPAAAPARQAAEESPRAAEAATPVRAEAPAAESAGDGGKSTPVA